MASVRQRARSVVLQALYEADLAGHPPRGSVERLLAEARLSVAGQELARKLVEGVVAHRDEIDRVLHESAPLRPLDQMSPVDRNILRVAIYEILFNNGARSAPVSVTVNEAVELAKSFGSENSPRFINGVLGTVSAQATGTGARG